MSWEEDKQPLELRLGLSISLINNKSFDSLTHWQKNDIHIALLEHIDLGLFQLIELLSLFNLQRSLPKYSLKINNGEPIKTALEWFVSRLAELA